MIKPLNQTDILHALEELSFRLGKRGVRGEVCLFGGTVMILAFQSRQSTKDIDAVFAPTSVIRELVAEIGRQNGYGTLLSRRSNSAPYSILC